MNDFTIKLLQDLVAVNSANPLLVPGGAGEQEIANVIAVTLRAMGLDVELSEAAPGRPNVVGILEGRTRGRSLMLCGHVDTVGVEGMPAPFDPVIRDGKLYGRGAQDMKGGVAAMIGAAHAIVSSGGLSSGRLIIAAVVDEEYTSLGAEELVKHRRADGAVVTEPTDLRVAVGHKGFSWVEVITEGVAAHGSRARDGRDAIFRMGRILTALEDLDRRLQSLPPHPVMGTASLHASLINGGRELSTYPDRCVMQMERRTIIGEAPELALTEIENIIGELRRADAEFKASARLTFARRPHEIPADHELPKTLQRVVSRSGRASECTGMSFWTDAAILGHAGIPTVLFGPGGAGLHGTEEYVKLDEVLACRDALADLAREFCSGSRQQ